MFTDLFGDSLFKDYIKTQDWLYEKESWLKTEIVKILKLNQTWWSYWWVDFSYYDWEFDIKLDFDDFWWKETVRKAVFENIDWLKNAMWFSQASVSIDKENWYDSFVITLYRKDKIDSIHLL